MKTIIAPQPTAHHAVLRTVEGQPGAPRDHRPWKAAWTALRPAHWLKNVLVFVPLLLGHRWRDLPAILRTLLGFAAFSLAASSIYVLNDLLDLRSDRLHPSKRLRPFASRQLSVGFGIALAVALLAPALVLSTWAGGAMGALWIAIYAASSLLYSLFLKRQPVLDVFLLASFYLQRVLYGGCISRVVVSNWLLAFCMFFFLSLALAKRGSELLRSGDLAQNGASGRGYLPGDMDFIRSLGIGSGLISVLVLALYVNSAEITLLYRHAQLLWAMVPVLLYWICRIWLVSTRGLLCDDPVELAFKDVPSIVAGILLVAIALAATF